MGCGNPKHRDLCVCTMAPYCPLTAHTWTLRIPAHLSLAPQPRASVLPWHASRPALQALPPLLATGIPLACHSLFVLRMLWLNR